MPKRSSKHRRGEDLNETAFRVLREATAAYEPEPQPANPAVEKNPAAVELGRLGGKKGGRVRAARLSPERRREIAEKAARARWGRRDQPDD